MLDAPPSPDRLIPLAEASRRLGVSTRTLKRMIAAGQLPGWQPPGRPHVTRISARVVDEILERASERSS